MKNIFIRILMIFVIAAGMTRCADVSPDDTDIIIYPESFSLKGLADERLNQSFEIVVKNKKGEPLNDVEITIAFKFAPDFNCPPSSVTCTIPPGLLLDENRNPQNSPFTTKTKEDGKYTVWLNYWHGAEWKGQLEVYSGTAYESADVEVKQ